MAARFRIIKEVLDDRGQGVISNWIGAELSTGDKAAIESRFNQIELSEIRNPNWQRRYTSLRMWEIKIGTGGKAIRILCEEDSTDVILLLGCVKRGDIKPADEKRASERRDQYQQDKTNVRDYPLPQRSSRDVGEPNR